MKSTGPFRDGKVLFLNPKTCGVYKSGGVRYRVDATGHRTEEVDNELLDHVDQINKGILPDGASYQDVRRSVRKRVLVPRYYDERWVAEFDRLIKSEDIEATTVGELIDDDTLTIRFGHGSPGNDQRNGTVPYIKVSDVRNLRINVNPTNMIPAALVRKQFWRGEDSGLNAWDLLTPIRASSNIGEFAILLPGEEQVVLTKEIMVFRINPGSTAEGQGWDAFYLLWALSLRSVRNQWQRIALMQTNREDIGDRYREIMLPKPPNKSWAVKVSSAFRNYYTSIADAKRQFIENVSTDRFRYIGNIFMDEPAAEKSSADEVVAE